MSFCAKTLTELMIAITEEQVCSWSPYDAALYFLLDILQDCRLDVLYFLHQVKSLFPDSLFKTILMSMSSDLQFLLPIFHLRSLTTIVPSTLRKTLTAICIRYFNLRLCA